MYSSQRLNKQKKIESGLSHIIDRFYFFTRLTFFFRVEYIYAMTERDLEKPRERNQRSKTRNEKIKQTYRVLLAATKLLLELTRSMLGPRVVVQL